MAAAKACWALMGRWLLQGPSKVVSGMFVAKPLRLEVSPHNLLTNKELASFALCLSVTLLLVVRHWCFLSVRLVLGTSVHGSSQPPKLHSLHTVCSCPKRMVPSTNMSMPSLITSVACGDTSQSPQLQHLSPRPHPQFLIFSFLPMSLASEPQGTMHTSMMTVSAHDGPGMACVFAALHG